MSGFIPVFVGGAAVQLAQLPFREKVFGSSAGRGAMLLGVTGLLHLVWIQSLFLSSWSCLHLSWQA
jgi:hypothetical protein